MVNLVNGLLLLNKPIEMTSNAALQKIKQLFQAKKAGHTGNLDPLASGMLPICFGEATKFSQFLLDSDKTYRVLAQLGVRTTTGDAEGTIISEKSVPALTESLLQSAFEHFRGTIQQIPSMFSAIKYQGKPLYELARRGIEVERKPRTVTIYRLELLNMNKDLVEFKVHCSKGTYVRNLVEDFGEHLGCGAYVKALHRLTVGQFQEASMVNYETLLENANHLEQLDSYLLPMKSMIQHFPVISLNSTMAFYLSQGQPILIPNAPTQGNVQLLNKAGDFLGVGVVLPDGRIAPQRLISA